MVRCVDCGPRQLVAAKKPPAPVKRYAKVVVDGETFFVDDMTLAEVALCENETGQSWVVANPYSSAAWALAIMTRFLARKVGEEKAAETIGAYTLLQALSAIKTADVDDRPTQYVDGVAVVDPKAVKADSATTGS